MRNVKFISYTGKWPNLCSGVLTVEIDGKQVGFGHEVGSYSSIKHGYTDGNFERFWRSSGQCYITNDNEEVVTQSAWVLDMDELDKQFHDIADLLIDTFNENVPHGCCGGCL